MKNLLNFVLLISIITSPIAFSSPLSAGYPKPMSMSELEKNPQAFLKMQRDYEFMKNTLYSENLSVDMFKFMVRYKNRLNKIKARIFSRRDGKSLRGKTLYFYRDFKNKKINLKLSNIDVVNINAVFLDKKVLRNRRNLKIKRYMERVNIRQTGVSRNYRYTNRKKVDDFVKSKLKFLTIKRKYKYYMKQYDINVLRFQNLPPKINKIIIYTRNQRINLKQAK